MACLSRWPVCLACVFSPKRLRSLGMNRLLTFSADQGKAELCKYITWKSWWFA